MSAQEYLFQLDIPPAIAVNDPLERCYTPDALAMACVQAVAWHEPGATIIEPSVGGGAFVRALRRSFSGCRIVGVDLDARAEGLALCDRAVVGDWSEVARGIQNDESSVRLVIGNPPFSRSLEHVQLARKLWPGAAVALILPLAYLGAGAWQEQMAALAELHPILGRPWPRLMRETALYVWLPTYGPTWTRHEPLVWR